MQLVGQMVLELGRRVDVQIALHRDQGHILTRQTDFHGQGVLGNRHIHLRQQQVAAFTADARLPLNAHVMHRVSPLGRADAPANASGGAG